MFKSVELFAGAGGLGMGVGLAGFTPMAVVERDRWAADTVRENAARDFPLVKDWPLFEGDVRHFDFDTLEDKIDLVSGGPPCQPFSLGGKHRANADDRDMFPVTVDVVRRLRPKAFILENVRGLTRSAFANYFQYILLQLSFPEIVRRPRDNAENHLKRLEEAKTSGRRDGLTYEVVHRVINAADYGIPQKRERVFIVGFRQDLEVKWSFPTETHSLDALLEDQWVTGDYWDRHRIASRHRSPTPLRLRRRIEAIRTSNDRPTRSSKPWRTVRDALLDMPDPRETSELFHDHRYQPGARAYPGHTGSPLDLPSKALKAGVHGVPGGENMMVLDDGSVRYFSVREAARLQTFPDGYKFHGAWSETMRQLGNAVPVRLAQTVASSVAEQLALRLEQELKQDRSA
ncbi:DNA cytosine methyltransferase [Roseospirillum parvum]|uniref:DNA (cytosine-5-)-methyltransferase n=1 Tax=Roseospirillum parvum TaxID=83401 RepID=A0A1G8EII4_9PROT|nr:DNA cytosine methyltransferase [Roseospirillum parvum]SDH69519.1 DNA (cytosine-5)-methyltransferase 1 [Roseospirillum parvum]